MATGLGLRIGTYESVAAIVTSGAAEPDYIVRETVLYMTPDGDSQLGGVPPESTSQTFSEFLARVGDSQGIAVDAETAYRAEDLVATAIFCLINLAAGKLAPPTEIHATYPAHWSTDAVEALRDALDYLGLGSLNLISEADAAAVAGEEPAHGAALAALASVAGIAATAGAAEQSIADPATEEMPTLAAALLDGPVVSALAYSALPDPPVPAAADPEPVEPRTIAAVVLARIKQKPVLVAAAFAAALALTSGLVAVALQDTNQTEIPQINSADAPSTSVMVPTTEPVAYPIPPSFVEPPLVEELPVVEVETTPEVPPVVPVAREPEPVPTTPPLTTTGPTVTDPPTTDPTTTTPGTETTDPTTSTEPRNPIFNPLPNYLRQSDRGQNGLLLPSLPPLLPQVDHNP